ncbi:MAG: hypothetical protein V4696_10130 [Pseudomonadota bacterium]
MSDWCILRTSGSKTLRLAETLRADGYDAWTPVETRTIRVPRANVRRTIQLPIMPSYVFARVYHLIDLLELAAMPVKPRRQANEPSHASFSVLHVHDKIPLVSDLSLDGLRYIEFKRTPRKKALEALRPGSSVSVEGGSFGGKKGVIERSDLVHTLVCFNGDNFPVKIPTSLFHLNDIGEVEALMGDAARKRAA